MVFWFFFVVLLMTTTNEKNHCTTAFIAKSIIKKESQTAARRRRILPQQQQSHHTTAIIAMTSSSSNHHHDADDEAAVVVGDNNTTTKSLSSYLQEKNVDVELSQVILSAAEACKKISKRLARLPITTLVSQQQQHEGITTTLGINVQGEQQKGMDVIANDIFISTVGDTVAAMVSEEEEDVVLGGTAEEKRYGIAFDPLDGSSNLDINIPTGTIFGIAPYNTTSPPFSCFSGRFLVAAGYAVYSSSVEFVVSLGNSGSLGAAGFALDPLTDGFVLSRPVPMRCPTNHGPYYSLNEGREPDWPEGLKRWVSDAKRGSTPSGVVFSSRYVCSLCADVHRTLLRGGWAGNPRPHLRLLYEAAPLAHCAEACGASSTDGTGRNLLDVVPKGLHDRVSVFIGSKGDIAELGAYGDIQQGAKTYHS